MSIIRYTQKNLSTTYDCKSGGTRNTETRRHRDFFIPFQQICNLLVSVRLGELRSLRQADPERQSGNKSIPL